MTLGVDEDPLVDLYASYRRELAKCASPRVYSPYAWYELPSTLSVQWMPFASMLHEFARVLANEINALTQVTSRLSAWGSLLPTLSLERRYDAKIEFVDVLGTAALGMPYAIKSRFTYAAVHLCHQANLASGRTQSDEMPPDEKLNLNEIDPICRGWRRFRRFKISVEGIAGAAFKDRSDDYRNAYHHRLPSQLVLGLSGLVTRVVEDGNKVSYEFGSHAPLDVGDVALLLAAERDQCAQAFERFQALVREHTVAMNTDSHP